MPAKTGRASTTTNLSGFSTRTCGKSASWMADGRFDKLVQRWAETAISFVTDRPAANRLALAEKLKVFARFVEELNGSMMDEREERMARAIAEDVGQIQSSGRRRCGLRREDAPSRGRHGNCGRENDHRTLRGIVPEIATSVVAHERLAGAILEQATCWIMPGLILELATDHGDHYEVCVPKLRPC